jgi:hypothetical protein
LTPSEASGGENASITKRAPPTSMIHTRSTSSLALGELAGQPSIPPQPQSISPAWT